MNSSHWHWHSQLSCCRSWQQKIALRVWGHLKKRDNPNSLDDDALCILRFNRLHLISRIACILLTFAAAAYCHTHRRVPQICSNGTLAESAMSYRCEEKDMGCTAKEFYFTIICEDTIICKEETQPKLLIIFFFVFITAQGLLFTPSPLRCTWISCIFVGGIQCQACSLGMHKHCLPKPKLYCVDLVNSLIAMVTGMTQYKATASAKQLNHQSRTKCGLVFWGHKPHQRLWQFCGGRARCRLLHPGWRSPETPAGCQATLNTVHDAIPVNYYKAVVLRLALVVQTIMVLYVGWHYLQNTARLLVNKSWNTLDTSTSCKTPDSRLGDPLDIVT